MSEVITQDGSKYEEPERKETPEKEIKPLNCYLLVEEVKEETTFKTINDSFSPQLMKVLAIDLAGEINVMVGETILAEHVYSFKINDKEYLFAKESEVIAVM